MNEHDPTQPEQHYTLMTGRIYDVIYQFKDYETEAKVIDSLIKDHSTSGGSDILEVACGTATYMIELEKLGYHTEGFDLSPGQIKEAKRRMPDTRLEIADMTDFDMGKQYDAVLCLFSSIGYLENTKQLSQAIAAMKRHLKPGGVLLVEPWLSKEQYTAGKEHSITDSDREITVTRSNIAEIDGDVSIMNMHHIVTSNTNEFEQYEFDELHRLYMFSDEEFQKAFDDAGLSSTKAAEGLHPGGSSRGLWIAR